MKDGFLVLDPFRRVVDINPAARKLLGLQSSIIGQNANVILSYNPDWLPEKLDAVGTQMVSFVHPETGRYVDIAVSALQAGERGSAGWLVLLRDVTDYKETESELRSLNRQLQEQISAVNLLHLRLEEQASRDPLTDLYNRRFLLQELEEFEKTARPFAILMIDVDYFKVINDQFGHRAGDSVLQHLAALFRSQMNETDLACRYGGEEFVLVLPETGQEAAVLRADKLRTTFASNPTVCNGAPVSATLSVGVALFPEHGATSEAVLHAADEALYAAKSAGRNQVVAWYHRLALWQLVQR